MTTNLPESAAQPATALNTHCPWSGKPVSADSLVRYRDAWVGFCNTGCRDKFQAALSHFDPLIELSRSETS